VRDLPREELSGSEKFLKRGNKGMARLTDLAEEFVKGVQFYKERAKIDGTTLREMLREWDGYSLIEDAEVDEELIEEIIDDLLDVLDILIMYYAKKHEVEIYDESGHRFARPLPEDLEGGEK
jgi:hypothetical protein